MKRAISVTIGEDNLVWLKGQAGASTGGSVSAVIDQLVREARTAGRTNAAAIRSVVGTIDLPPDDPDLAGADAYVRGLFDRSLGRPMQVRERPPARKPKRRG
jgi:hypothetical protein